MTPAVALKQHFAGEPPAAPNRDEVLARYRHLRAISRRHNTNLLKFVSIGALLHQACRLDLARGKTFILDSEDEMSFVFDLAIYTALSGRTRAIDRYARSIQLEAGSDEARVLEAMRNAHFAIVRVERRHDVAGLVISDLIRKRELWLVDEGMEQSMTNGSLLATRLFSPDEFTMTAGIGVPLDTAILADVLLTRRFADKSPNEAVDNRRFAESIYRAALAEGIADRIRFQDLNGEAA